MTIMENKRFFSFGCSFTKYAWPTWADLIASLFPNFYNYGQPGAGNSFIFNAIMEADQRHKFNKNDLIIIQWSGPCREDRYKDGKWITSGNIANYYSVDYVKNFFDFRGFLLRDLAAIKATKYFLENIGCDYRFISMVSLKSNNEYQYISDHSVDDICDFYSDVLDVIKPSFIEVLGDYGNIRPKKLYNIHIEDNHPLPTEHLKYVRAVLPEFNVDENLANFYDKKVADIWESHNCGWTYDWHVDKNLKPITRL